MTTTYTVGDRLLSTHPVADEYPMMSEAELGALADDIARCGLKLSICLAGDEILDGRNRLAACQLAGVEPTFYVFRGDPTDHEAVRAFVRSLNEHRRHLTPEWRAARHRRILERRGQGESLRAIAEAEGVGRSTVHRAVASAVPNGTPGEVTGRDGRTYPASKPKTPQEAGESILADAADGALPAAKTVLLDGEDDTPRDALGIPIQPHAEAAFAPESMALFRDVIGQIRAIRRLVHHLAEMPGGALLQRQCAYQKHGDSGSWRLHHLESALREIESCIPSVTDCPLAFGEAEHPEPCPACHGLRWIGPPECYPAVGEGALARMRAHYGAAHV